MSRRGTARLLASTLALVLGCAGTAAAAPPGNGRAWELVTPADPVAAVLFDVPGISASGDRVVYNLGGSLPDPPAGEILGIAAADRGPDGWSSHALGAPYTIDKDAPLFAGLLPLTAAVLGLSADLSTTFWQSVARFDGTSLTPGRQGFFRIEEGGRATLLAETPFEGFFVYLGASQDGSHVVFSSGAHLLPADAARTKGSSIYEAFGSSLRLVDVNAAGEPLSPCGSTGFAAQGVSHSSARIFFSTMAPSTPCSSPSRVYLREDGSTTVEVSASRCTRPDCGPPRAVTFAAATPTGSSAFLVTAQQLVDADLDNGRDLYRYDSDSAALSLLSGGSPEIAGAVATGPVRTSADGSRAYFLSSGPLLPGESCAGATCLYLSDHGALRLVAAIEAGDPIQTDRGGGALLIATERPLTGDDGDASKDVFRYDADTGSLERISSGPVGGGGAFDADILTALEEANPGLVPKPDYHALSDDGRRAFFSTAESLVADDVNGVTDVYEWVGGSADLISSGRGDDPALYGGVSADGSTALFKTPATLLPEDRDGGEYDLYAARLGGGFPAAPPPPGCTGDCSTPAPRPRVERSRPASAIPGPGARPRRLRLLSLGREPVRRILAEGDMLLSIAVPSRGPVSARGFASLGGVRRTVVRGDSGAVRPGGMDLAVTVTAPVRRRLRSGRGLRIRLVLTQREARLARTVELRPEEPR